MLVVLCEQLLHCKCWTASVVSPSASLLQHMDLTYKVFRLTGAKLHQIEIFYYSMLKIDSFGRQRCNGFGYAVQLTSAFFDQLRNLCRTVAGARNDAKQLPF